MFDIKKKKKTIYISGTVLYFVYLENDCGVPHTYLSTTRLLKKKKKKM